MPSKKYQRKTGRKTKGIKTPRYADNPQEEEDAIEYREVDADPPNQDVNATGTAVSGLRRSARIRNQTLKAKDTAFRKSYIKKNKVATKKKNSEKSTLKILSVEAAAALMREEQVNTNASTLENNAINKQSTIGFLQQICHKFLSLIPFRLWGRR